MHDLLAHLIDYVVPSIQLIGVLIVIWGVLDSAVRVLRREWQLARRGSAAWSFGEIRLAIGRKMVLGLEFFVASDIIQTVVVPTWESLGILAGIVAIRTVIVYFLEYEMRTGVPE
ncbi:MAG: DUF1622 domain-containing protein [Gammaproteobacteria bacterium]|nr:DUF1622 domain-containing protein [Gammaproteobacteria bacterium]